MENESRLALRWHVARFHEASRGDPHAKAAPRHPWLEVVIAKSGADLPDDLRAGHVPVIGRTDQLGWWVTAEDELLHGWIAEEVVRGALESAARIEGKIELMDVGRRITEDMVFLQCALDGRSVAEYWDHACAQEALPDVASLLALSDRWCDFTKPARRMAKNIYAQVLKDSEDDTEARNGGKFAAE